MWRSAIAYIDAAKRLIAPLDSGDRIGAIAEIARLDRARRFRAYGVSVDDLCESGAVLESYKAYRKLPSLEDFIKYRDQYFPGKGNSVYRRTFDIMADERGADVAFDLLPVITLLALQGDIPGRSFELLISDDDIPSRELVGASARDIAQAFGMPQSSLAAALPERLEQTGSEERHPVFYPLLLHLSRVFGADLFEMLARPSKALSSAIDEAFLPPIVVGARELGEKRVGVAFGVAKHA
jgi:hypothetical protein